MTTTFDFIIVGGGTAACVLANQLLCNSKATIAVIEAGSFPTGRICNTPAMYPLSWNSSKDWSLETVPQKSLRNRRINWPRGRMLGGSSSMNASIYSHGHADDSAAYPPTWHWREIRESWKATAPACWYETLNVQESSECFLNACDSLGISRSRNGNADCEAGSGVFLRTAKNGRRHSAYHAFLKPMLDHPRLTVIRNAICKRILFRDQRASGVEIADLHNPNGLMLGANKAVCVCCGSIASPQLLMQSGIGPRRISENLQVPVVAAIDQVGQNLKDHLVFPLVMKVDPRHSLEPVADRAVRFEYARQRTGTLASNIAEAGAFLKVDSYEANRDGNLGRPNIQLHFTPTHYLQYPLAREHVPAISIGVTPLHPRSSGSIDFDPGLNKWTIDPNYLGDQNDMELFVRSVKVAGQLFEQDALAKIVAMKLVPKCNFDDDRRIEAAIRAFSLSIYHPTGTCRIGSDADSVVDEKCRVRSLEQLYVADASVIPEPTTGNPQGTLMALAAHIGCTLVTD